MKLAKLLVLLVSTLALGSGVVAWAQNPPRAEAAVPVALEPLANEAPASCAVPQTERVQPPAAVALAASGGHGFTCNYCSSSSQCQPICGGQVGSDFVCHYDEACGPWRVCICFF
jgi:hypothetical protein